MTESFFQFSKKEITDITLALVTLAFSFELILFRNEIFVEGALTNISLMLNFFVQSLIVVGFAFVLHELGHKYLAQKKGLWAEFRAWPVGLFLAVVMAIVSRGGFVFAAPGAVMISQSKKTRFGYSLTLLEDEDVGKIGLIGPVINIILGLLFIGLSLLIPLKIFDIGAQVNAWLAIFNLVPLSILDGAKVWKWSKGIWAGAFLLSIFIFILAILL